MDFLQLVKTYDSTGTTLVSEFLAKASAANTLATVLKMTDKHGQNALMVATMDSNAPEKVAVLLEYKADVHALDNSGNSALFHACENFDENDDGPQPERELPGSVQQLLDSKADIEFRNSGGLTALNYCSMISTDYHMQVLLQNGANTETVDDYGYTPLRQAAHNGGAYKKCISLLIEAKATVDLKIQNEEGVPASTPLFEHLIQGNGRGCTPLCIAKQLVIEGQASLEHAQYFLKAYTNRSQSNRGCRDCFDYLSQRLSEQQVIEAIPYTDKDKR
jgi:ankyrin repeat protein